MQNLFTVRFCVAYWHNGINCSDSVVFPFHPNAGADAFKDIARVSTHTILAACGFEHRKIVRAFPTLLCDHSDQTQQLSRSTLMASSCRECFYRFVKNVVNSIMLEKLDSSVPC